MAIVKVRHLIAVSLASAAAAISGSASVAMRWFKGDAPPLHPTIIFTTYQDKELPVLGVEREAPKVEVDGKLKTLPSNRPHQYAPKRASGYAPGTITVSDIEASSGITNLILMTEQGDVNGGVVHAGSDFAATVTPSQDFKDCFLAIVFFEKAYLDGQLALPNAMVEFRQLPDLVAGQPKKISFSFAYLDFQNRNMAYFPLFFTGGREIRSNHAELVAKFFAKLEQSRHEKIVESYRDKNRGTGKSAPPQVYLQVPPLFIDQSVLDGAPSRTEVSFMVTEEGNVEGLQFEGPLPPAVTAVLRPTLNAWRFLPRLKGGIAERTMIRVPIVLKK